ncbi:hypothetical protein CHUAL_002820 [Chamberlinius hualienensis]
MLTQILNKSGCTSRIALNTLSRINLRYAGRQIRVGGHSKNVWKQFRREYGAVCNLLRRSGFNEKHLSNLSVSLRWISASQNLPQQQKNEKNHEKNSNENENTTNNNNNNDEEPKISLLAKAAVWLMTAYVVITVMSLLFPTTNQPEVTRFISWTEFVHQILAKGEVEQLVVRPDLELVTIYLHDDAIIKGRRTEYRHLNMNIVDIGKFEEKLRIAESRLGIGADKGVPVVYERNQDSTGILLVSLVAVALMILIMFRSGTIKTSVDIKSSMDIFSQLTRAKFTIVDPLAGGGKGVLFKDVAGLKEAKQEVIEFVDYLKRPDIFQSLGAKVPRGALLLGPPGCGKTLLAKAIATEGNVPFLAMAGSEFVEMIGGLGAARVRDLFKEARKRAPCIIYIDEIDAIGRKRSNSANESGMGGEEEQTLNQLLVEMDGIATKEGVLILASTNRAEVLDKALLRPGRFDRHILIDFPTVDERKEIFDLHLKSIHLKHQPSTYSPRLAQLTPRFSGADIANVCNEAALHAARNQEKVVDLHNLSYAVERVVGGTEKRTQVMSAEERQIVAYHESGHALVGWMLKHTDALLKISIVPRTSKVLGFAQYVPTDKRLYSKEELFDRMCMLLGGRVAESLVFNRVTTGAEDDLKKVTKLAASQVKEHGMSELVGHVSFDDDPDNPYAKKPYSKRLSALIDQEVMRMVTDAYKTTEMILNQNRDKLSLVAETLLKNETLSYEQMESLIGSPPHGKKKLVAPVDMTPNVEPTVHSSSS